MARSRSLLGRWPGIAQGSTPLIAAGATALALGAGFLGQGALDRQPPDLRGWAALLLGAVTFAWLARRQALERAAEAPSAASTAPRLALLAPALALAGLAFPAFAGNRWRLLPTLAWIAALGLLYLSFHGRAPGQERGARWRPGDGIHLSWHALALLGIVLLGVLLRFYRLDAIPREMGTDMPLKYDNALEIMQGQFMIFCPRYPGREALFFYLVAAYGRLFGLSYFAIKAICALVGVATIPVLYGAARCLFDRQVALLAAAFLAVNKWHVILSRTGYRSVLVPLFLAALLFLLARAWRRGRSTDLALAGMAIGLGMYTYSSFLVVPPAVAAASAVELARRGRRSLRQYGWGLLALALGALLVYLPLGRYALEAPQAYMFRVATRMTGLEVPLPHDVLRVFAGNLWRAMGMFNLRGDALFLLNVPFQRQLGVVSAVLFVFGLAYALLRIHHGHHAMILAFLAAFILPTALSVAFPSEVPSSGRVSGLLTPVCLLVALPPVLLYRRLACLLCGGKLSSLPGQAGKPAPTGLLGGAALAAVGLVALLGVEFRETWRIYYGDYVAHLPQRNYAITLELARALDDYAGQGQAFIKYVPYWYDGNALRVQLRVMPRSWEGELSELDPAKPPLSTVEGPAMFILHPQDRAALKLLLSAFPRGVAVQHRDLDGQPAFITFFGER